MRRLLAALFLTPLLLSSAAAETVRFQSANWPPTPLQLSRAASGHTIAEQASVEITGELYRPPGRGPFPAIVLLHPCSGRLPASVERADSERYVSLGYVLLAVDSLGSRGIGDGCSGGGLSVDGIMDAYGALLYLARRPFVDPERIAVVGYSSGADVALSVVAFDGPERLFDQQFRAAVAYYPSCQRQETPAVAVPTLMLVGELDSWAQGRHCRALMARQRGLGPPIRLLVYPDAYHAFNLNLAPRTFYGHRLEYDPAADSAAWSEVTALLRQTFGR